MSATPPEFVLDPFHPGEIAAQERTGGRLRRAPIRSFMPDQHRQFFSRLPFLPIGAADPSGHPVATILAGEPGFISTPDSTTIRIEARLRDGDPATRSFRPGAQVGLLGIDLATRRRNRASGEISGIDDRSITVAVRHSFGNCPQYIQVRELKPRAAGAPPDAGAEILSGLDQTALELIKAADTFFVASTSGTPGAVGGGVDISHRGGRPGFVWVDGASLTIPDFHGNRHFNTLGNFVLDPRAALLFVDFVRGDLLHLRGRAEVAWDGAEHLRFTGAERLWRFHVQGGWRISGALPYQWTPHGTASESNRTGQWNTTEP